MFARSYRLLGFFAAAVLLMAGAASADGVRFKPVTFDDLPGWQQDDLADTLIAFRTSCRRAKDSRLTAAQWSGICSASKRAKDPRVFFEAYFQPVQVIPEKPVLFTGYYEPELQGARRRGGKFQYPIYRKPRDWSGKGRWKSRAEIESGAIQGRGLELAWLTDPVEAYFLQIQGSGRIRLTDGGALRAGFSASNGHEYRSIGKELIRRGVLGARGITAAAIKNWVRENPDEGRELLNHNPRYIFFREVTDLPADSGPIGAMSVPLSALRSIAVDPDYIPLGSPVWIDKQGKDPLRRLFMAQDVGGAIKGPHRGDIFYGSGGEAGRIAGRTKGPGELYILLPKAALGSFAPRG